MTLETKEALENLSRAFEQFKTTNDDRLGEIERKGQADVVTEEKLARLDQEIQRLHNMTRSLHMAGGRPALDGKTADSGPDLQQKAQFFDGFIRKGQEITLDQKALSTAVDTDGGYTVPVALDQQIEKRLRDISPIRAEAHVIAIGTSRYKKLVNTGGMTSGWVSESGARIETDSPSFQEIEPPLGEIYANPAATQTMLDDAFFNVESWLSEELAEEFAQQENAAFVTGDGVNKPKGFLTYALSANDDGSRAFGEIETLATGVAGNWAATDPSDILVDMVHALKSGYRAEAKFYMNTGLLSEIRKFKDADGHYLWRPGLESGAAATLLGYPVVEVAEMPNRAVFSLSLCFANMKRAYSVTDRMGTRILRDPYSHKPYVHFYTTKRVGGAVTNDQAIKLLQFSA
ncbi:phage major capsid protein [Paremcibacter congregatus]|uniref:Phage major capsid protein n=1 Tax=Paremcibacter congregatus TaxID=2043170 RepID=A0A2G4YRD7_9PROT|nr:phage major capsid protein [Paremcibacter congregatus]PHZ84899.1 phage major capsid protein [Paremcibacter congregatus]QDE26127.1 phage major capsid protein [Paremcibacter congregatus]